MLLLLKSRRRQIVLASCRSDMLKIVVRFSGKLSKRLEESELMTACKYFPSNKVRPTSTCMSSCCRLHLFVVFEYSPCVCVGFHWVHRFSPTSQKMPIGGLAVLNCQLVWMRMWVCVWRMPCDGPASHPKWILASSQSDRLIHHDADRDKELTGDEWMNERDGLKLKD